MHGVLSIIYKQYLKCMVNRPIEGNNVWGNHNVSIATGNALTVET